MGQKRAPRTSRRLHLLKRVGSAGNSDHGYYRNRSLYVSSSRSGRFVPLPVTPVIRLLPMSLAAKSIGRKRFSAISNQVERRLGWKFSRRESKAKVPAITTQREFGRCLRSPRCCTWCSGRPRSIDHLLFCSGRCAYRQLRLNLGWPLEEKSSADDTGINSEHRVLQRSCWKQWHDLAYRRAVHGRGIVRDATPHGSVSGLPLEPIIRNCRRSVSRGRSSHRRR